jgi:hypothetical protein
MATIESQETDASRARRYSQAAMLLDQWMKEDSDFDRLVGTLLGEDVIDDSIRCGNDDPIA